MPAGLLYSLTALVPGRNLRSQSRVHPAPDHRSLARRLVARVDRTPELRWESMALGVVRQELAEAGLVGWHWNEGFACEIEVETSLVVDLRPQHHRRQN